MFIFHRETGRRWSSGLKWLSELIISSLMTETRKYLIKLFVQAKANHFEASNVSINFLGQNLLISKENHVK